MSLAMLLLVSLFAGIVGLFLAPGFGLRVGPAPGFVALGIVIVVTIVGFVWMWRWTPDARESKKGARQVDVFITAWRGLGLVVLILIVVGAVAGGVMRRSISAAIALLVGNLIFGSADELINLIDQARPGDHFTLYDLDRVAPLALLHLGEPASQAVVPITTTERLVLAQAGMKSQWRAVILLQRACGTDGRLTRCSIVELEPDDLTDNWEEAKDFDARLTWPREGTLMPLPRWFGELLAFDEADLDRNAETGHSIETVSSLGLTRTYALVDAKRPDENGLVPISGAY